MIINQTQCSDINIVYGRASPSYIIDGESIAVVDVCFPSDAKIILNFVHNSLGRHVEDIKLIILTHSHLDHVNGVDYLIDNTHASLAAHTNAQQYLTGKRAIPLAKWCKLTEFMGFMAKHSFPRPSVKDVFSMPWSGIPGIKKAIRAKVTHLLIDGDGLPKNPEWKVIHTPGHTSDSICLYNPRYRSLITGDTIINDKGHLKLNPLLILDDRALQESLKRLKQLKVDRIYPGFGTPVFGKDIINRIFADV